MFTGAKRLKDAAGVVVSALESQEQAQPRRWTTWDTICDLAAQNVLLHTLLCTDLQRILSNNRSSVAPPPVFHPSLPPRSVGRGCVFVEHLLASLNPSADQLYTAASRCQCGRQKCSARRHGLGTRWSTGALEMQIRRREEREETDREEPSWGAETTKWHTCNITTRNPNFSRFRRRTPLVWRSVRRSTKKDVAAEP